MTDLILEFLEFCEKSLKNSVYMGPDGTLYEMAMLMLYVYVQAYVFFCPKFLEILPKRSTLGIIIMVFIFFPGMLAKIVSQKAYVVLKYTKRFLRNMKIIIKRKLKRKNRTKNRNLRKVIKY